MNTSNVELAEFAARLQKLLDQHAEGNQSALARAAGCTPQAVSKWLAGEQYPRAKLLPKIAAFLHTTPTYLRFGEAPEQLPPPPPPAVPPLLLMYVDTVQEAVLLSHFREGTDLGKQQLLLSAAMIQKKPAEELPAKPAASLH
jgi:transcriptional regulator with XRE-family HTH domain